MKKKNKKINEKKLTKASALSFQNIFKRETKLAAYIIACMTIVVISLSYAMFFQVDNNSTNQEVIAGDLKFTYTDGVVINSTDNSKCFEPMNQDEAGLYASECSYQFSVQNTGSLKASYTLKLLANETNTSDPSKLKVILKKQNGDVLEIVSGYPKTIGTLTNSILLEASMESYDISVYSVQIYVDESLYEDSDAGLTVSYKIEGTGVVHEGEGISPEATLANCKKTYGESAKVCNIIASVDTTGKCPTVNEDGTVNVTSAETTNALVCSAPDDYGTSYYYRGVPENNWVKFGGYYWRILRVNGDNSIRMIYAGDASVIDALDTTTKASVLKNGYNDYNTKYTQIGKSRYNYYWKKDNVEDTSKYVYEDNAGIGYMYGNLEDGQTNTTSKLQAQTNTNDSDIKAYLDNWYTTNLAGYETYISDTLFCNDRTITSGNGYGISTTSYRTYSPSNGIKLTCQEQNDRFTVNDEVNGNGDLTYPIGLITIDEVYLAGGYSSANNAYYLYTRNWYWTMSPSDFYGNYANVGGVDSGGRAVNGFNVNDSDGVRAVINLKSGSLTKGSGLASDPYRVS